MRAEKRLRPSPAEAAKALRCKILKSASTERWLTSADLAERLAQGAEPSSSVLSQMRAGNEILGLWSHSDKTFVYPPFQFTSTGAIHPRTKELLTVIADTQDTGGWRRAFLLMLGNELLGGATVADTFAEDPDRAIRVAQVLITPCGH